MKRKRELDIDEYDLEDDTNDGSQFKTFGEMLEDAYRNSEYESCLDDDEQEELTEKLKKEKYFMPEDEYNELYDELDWDHQREVSKYHMENDLY